MNFIKRYLFRRTLLVVLAAGLLNVSGIAFANPIKVALVLPGSITDKSWNQAGYEGLMRVKEELGVEVAFSEKVAQPDQAEALADYARRGYNVVAGHGGEFQEAANRVADRYPDTIFIVHNGVEPNGKNVAITEFYYSQFGYILGYIAGKMSDGKKTGFIGAQKVKSHIELIESYTNGFKSVHPDGEVITAWTNDWDDIAKGKEAALIQINDGADVIFPTQDNAAIGSLQALRDKKVWGFGLWYDAIADWPDTVLQSAIFDIRSVMVEYVRKAKTEGLKGVTYNFNLNTPGQARMGTYHSAIPSDVKAEVETLIRKMKSGEFKP
jgi:basic membrane protein A